MTDKHKFLLNKWKLLIEDRINSGMTVVDWCKANGYNKHTYYYWLTRVQQDSYDDAVSKLPMTLGHEGNTQAFVELSNLPVTDSISSPIIPTNPVAVIHKGDLAIDIYSDNDSFLIKSIIEALYHVQA